MKLGELAEQFQLECRGGADAEITGIASPLDANSTQLAFLFSSSYRTTLAYSNAAAFVLREEDADGVDRPLLIAENPRMAWAKIAALFDTQPMAMPFIDPTSIISELADIGSKVAIGPNVVIRPGAVIADGANIGAGCYIGEGSRIGVGSRLFANVVVYHDVVVGDGCVVHGNVVLGADGFGYEFDSSTDEYVKIPQIYGVRIGNQVDIGAGTTIDRGAMNHTSIRDGCKLDNQVQVGHGTQIDHHTVISGCTAIAGSTKIGSYCLIGGGVGIVDNIEIVDQVEITAMTLVSQSILEKGRYSSGTGLMPGFEWKRSAVAFKKLHDMLKRIARLERDR